MSALGTPIRDALDDRVDEVRVQRMWRRILSRRARREVFLSHAKAGAVGFAVAAAALLVLLVRSPSAPHVAARTSGALHRVDGAEMQPLESPANARADWSVALDDGSTLTLAPATRIDPLENTGSAFSALLVNGRARFEVRPGGPRRWAIECGVATVEVVGTGFVIERHGEHVSVSVLHGVVLVRGERVPERVQRLVAGQSIEVGAAVASSPTAVTHDAAPVSAPNPLPPPVRAVRHESPLATTTQPVPDWRALARAQDFRGAYDVLGASGIASTAQHASVGDLLVLADVARWSGHPVDARAPLQRIIDEHASEREAGLAAFTLGRVDLDQLHDARGAAEAFGRAVTLGVPQGLDEDAWARLVEARATAGDRAGAREAAERYRTLFPRGRRAAQVARWAQGD